MEIINFTVNFFKIIFLIIFIILILAIFVAHKKTNLVRYTKINNSCYEDILNFNYLNKPRVKNKNKIVISLTTIPSRIDKLYITLFSLLDQTRRVDEIILNIPYKSRKNIDYVIPKWLDVLKNKSSWLVLNRCEDYGPITKVLPTIDLYRGKNVDMIVLDDDTIYNENIVRNYCYFKNMFKKKVAITGTGYRMFKKDNTEMKYDTSLEKYGIKQVDILMGYTGYIINSDYFEKDFYDFYKSDDKFIFVDDNCISLYLRSKDIPVYSLRRLNGFSLNNANTLYRWLLDYNSDALSKNENKSNGGIRIYGQNEIDVLDRKGYYLKEIDFLHLLL